MRISDVTKATTAELIEAFVETAVVVQGEVTFGLMRIPAHQDVRDRIRDEINRRVPVPRIPFIGGE